VIHRRRQWRYDPSVPERDIIHSLEDGAGATPKRVFTQEHFDWQGDQPLRHFWSKSVIYEAPVRGLTIHPSSVVENPGTYRGLMEKIPYLKDLGVTVVELMPVQEFNGNRATAFDPQKLEFREMVQALLSSNGSPRTRS
jgi:isoamylase